MKKIIAFLLLSISLNVSSTEYKESAAYQKHSDKFSKYELNTQFTGDKIEKINYLGDQWILTDYNDLNRFYVQINTKTNLISRIRIISKYDEVLFGKEIKHLEFLYGKSITNKGQFLYLEEKDSRVRIYSDYDLIEGKTDEMFSIVEFFSYTEEDLRIKTIKENYYEERMIRK